MPAHNPMFSYGSTSAPMSGYAQTGPASPGGNQVGHGSAIVDATPMRVVTLTALAIGGVVGLRWAGFKFNVTAGV